MRKEKPTIKQDYRVEMEKSLEQVKDPELKDTLAGVMDRIKDTHPFEELKEVKKQITKAAKKEEQMVLAFIPHEMAKVSIFFPMSKNELREERRLLHKLLAIESNWGRLEIEGVKLAIFEEDIFLALMREAKNKLKCVEGEYLLETSIPEISNFLYGHAGYTKNAYKRILKALTHFGLVSFCLVLFDSNKKDEKSITISGILNRHDYNKKTKTLKIYFNPHFCAFFLKSMLTCVNYTVRRKLKRDGSKALLRFLMAHRNPGKMHILTVLKAINFNIDQPMNQLRFKLKTFIQELKKQQVLSSKTKIYTDDTVFFEILPYKKVLSN